MNIDKFFGRVYDAREYNCLHFTCEVWADLTGEDIRARMDGLLAGAVEARKLRRPHVHAFKRLPSPVGPCLVLFQAPKAAPHIGVYLRERVLHIQSSVGVHFIPLQIASIGFTKTRFLLPC
jgi:hypothetical protein